MTRSRFWTAALVGLVAVPSVALAASGALAAGIGKPEPWQIAMQVPVTPIARELHSFHTLLMWLITIITLFVAGLLGWCLYRFNEKSNPVPSRTAHNTTIEIAWTVIPVLILVLIAIPSFRLLRGQLILPPADITIKTVGNAWYWSYEYLTGKDGAKEFGFDQRIIADPADQSKAMAGPDGTPRLLATDNDLVVPINKVVRVQVTAADVLHSFAMPSFGIKTDAVPGRLNETWFKAEREGTYHGQCSELCGQFHAYMPITIKVVSQEAYEAWHAQAKTKFATSDDRAGPTRLADADLIR